MTICLVRVAQAVACRRFCWCVQLWRRRPAAGHHFAGRRHPPPRRALPPGSPLIGRPDGEAAAKLSPVAAPPIAAAADKLPTAKLKLPQGFNIEVYAAGLANAR